MPVVVKVLLIIMSLTNVRTGLVDKKDCEMLARAAVHDRIGDRAACIGLDGEFLFAYKDEGEPT